MTGPSTLISTRRPAHHPHRTSQHSTALNKIAREDWPAVHAWARLPEACRHQPWGPNTEAQTQDFVDSAVKAWSDTPPSAASPTSPTSDGRRWAWANCMSAATSSAKQRQGEISYIVHPRLWGQGIGTEIARQLLAHGFGELGLHRIHATCDPRNLSSSRILSKIGMTQEDRVRHTALLHDGRRDSMIFSSLEGEWHPTA
ncbi:GNAT family N-acetyltransferase [Streptomyces sp. NPDC002426]